VASGQSVVLGIVLSACPDSFCVDFIPSSIIGIIALGFNVLGLLMALYRGFCQGYVRTPDLCFCYETLTGCRSSLAITSIDRKF
jgi:hypothetical protein